MSLASGIYKAGLRVAKEVSNDIPTLMDKFGTYGRVTRPGNVPGWAAPSRLEARKVNKAYKVLDSGAASKTKTKKAYNIIDDNVDYMERGEAAPASSTAAVRTHLEQHLNSKGIKHTQKNPRIKSMYGGGNSDWFNRSYAPRGGDLEPGHYARTSKSKKDLLAERRKAALNRKAGMR